MYSNSSFNPNIIPFDDTYILYDSTDFLSFVSAYFSLIPIAILVFQLSWFITTREFEACIMAAGQVSNEVLNNIIKIIVRQPRPMSFGESFQNGTVRSGYGMPSAHSQFMGFFCMYTSLRYCLRWKGLTPAKRIMGIATVTGLATCVCFSRVYLRYHTMSQVVVGFMSGLCSGSTYFLVVAILRELKVIDWVLQWRLAQILHVKDSCNQAPITLKEEYENYKQRLQQKAKNE